MDFQVTSYSQIEEFSAIFSGVYTLKTINDNKNDFVAEEINEIFPGQ